MDTSLNRALIDSEGSDEETEFKLSISNNKSSFLEDVGLPKDELVHLIDIFSQFVSNDFEFKSKLERIFALPQ